MAGLRSSLVGQTGSHSEGPRQQGRHDHEAASRPGHGRCVAGHSRRDVVFGSSARHGPRITVHTTARDRSLPVRSRRASSGPRGRRSCGPAAGLLRCRIGAGRCRSGADPSSGSARAIAGGNAGSGGSRSGCSALALSGCAAASAADRAAGRGEAVTPRPADWRSAGDLSVRARIARTSRSSSGNATRKRKNRSCSIDIALHTSGIER